MTRLDDAQAQDEAVAGWYDTKTPGHLGFSELRPNALLSYPPSTVAKAVERLLDEPQGHCVLMSHTGSVRPVLPWNAPATAPEALDRQEWSGGFLRDLDTVPAPAAPGLWLGHCRTPAGALAADLESNSGKGTTAAQARISTTGEAVERLAAWRANTHLQRIPPETATEHHSLEDFHPWGAPLRQYLADGRPPLPATPTRRAHDGAQVAVPLCLVPFPYQPLPGETRPTSNDTTGLACYPDRDEAILRGGLEVLERNTLYRNLLHLRPGLALDPWRWATDPPALVPHLTDTGRLYVIGYPHTPPVAPVVHAFLLRSDGRYAARASGSGRTLRAATDRALLELLQVDAQFRTGVPERLGVGHRQWSSPEAVDCLGHYLERSATGNEPPAELVRLTQHEPLRDLAHRLHAAGTELLVADLPSSVKGWHTVRVLAPRLVTHQNEAPVGAGVTLQDAPFPFSVPM
ncbi:YcaO-like family protein [Streptomyces sp. NPDC052114]|uniref:YcaO-like family protein n=1 Tax=unclassified Streptomyces TaxID=2593676 RepID=UPI00342D1368